MSDENKINDGGAAFPSYSPNDVSTHDPGGMSLRDWFAGQALPAKITDAERWNDKARESTSNARITQRDVAVACYLYADAMLTLRKAKP